MLDEGSSWREEAFEMERQVRDPIHGFVYCNDRECKLIDTFPVQRLRKIHQLAMSYLLYPGANHRRFDHTLGVMHVAGRLARSLKIPEPQVQIIRFAAILHDIGHGPFSHVSEQLLEQFVPADAKKGGNIETIHEQITVDLIRNWPEFKSVMNAEEIESVAALIAKQERRSLNKDVVSGPIDADKLDYLLRDSYFCGVKYGVFDLDQIVGTVRSVQQGGQSYLTIDEDGLWAVEQLLLAKHHMDVQVYRRKTRSITDAMIVRGSELAIEEGVEEMRALYAYEPSEVFLSRYLAAHDEWVLQTMIAKVGTKSSRFFRRLAERKLFKEIYREDIVAVFPNAALRDQIAKMTKAQRKALEKAIAGKIGVNDYEVIVDLQSISNPTFKSPSSRIDENDILVMVKRGVQGEKQPEKFQEVSEVFYERRDPKEIFLCVYAPLDSEDEEKRREVKKLVHGLIEGETWT
jgi:HD superfamily phosphohydrolase